VQYAGNGATVDFAVPYPFLRAPDLVVTVAGVTKTLNVDYTVAGAHAPGGGGGSVTFGVAPGSGATVIISRVVQLVQPVSFAANGPLSPAVLEDSFDTAMMAAQQLRDADGGGGGGGGGGSGGSSVASVTSIAALRTNPVATSPCIVQGFANPGDGGGGVFYWDAAGPSGYLDDNVGVIVKSSLTGAASGRWRREGFASALRPDLSNHYTAVPASGVNVKWFGAVGDGHTDDTVAVQAASDAAAALGNDLYNLVDQAVGSGQGAVACGFPPGVYLVSRAASGNWGVQFYPRVNYIGLGGHSSTFLKTASTTIAIVNWAVAASVIQGFTFQGGLHAIGMYMVGDGPAPGYPDPTAYGNVAARIRDCVVDKTNPAAGPWLWQASGPIAVVTSGSNGQTLPQATIHVDSTTQFQNVSQDLTVIHQDGSTDSFHATGITSNTFTGGTGGSTTLQTGDVIVRPANWRSAQHTLIVEDFQHFGAHMFWGTFDFLTFVNGHVAWDFTNAVNSKDGMPLGVFNSCGSCVVNNVSAAGTGSQPARGALFVGAGGEFDLGQTVWSQNDGLCFIRQQVKLNWYQGAGRAAVPMPNEGVGNVIKLDKFAGVCSFGAFWLECIDYMPFSISIKNWADGSADFYNTKGIFIERGVFNAANANLDVQTDLCHFDTDGLQFDIPFSIWMGTDPGPSAAPVRANCTNVTERFTTKMVSEYQKHRALAEFQPNLGTANFNDQTQYRMLFTSETGASYTTSGYTLHRSTAANLGDPGPSAIIWGAADWMSGITTPGIYTFSFYCLCNWAGSWGFSVGPHANHGPDQFKYVGESPTSLQRIEFPFYYDGSGNWVAQIAPAAAPATVVAWAPGSYSAGVEGSNTHGQRITKAGNRYVCIAGGTSVGGPPDGSTGHNIQDQSGGSCAWDYVEPGGTYTATGVCGLYMINPGRGAAPFILGGSAGDASLKPGFVPGLYYGTAAPTQGTYKHGDMVFNVNAVNAGDAAYWYCTVGGTPGTWRSVLLD